MALSSRATAWHLRSRILRFGRLPLLMGIVNVTPDSFSDGGNFLDRQSAVEHALRLLDDGATILDIGGESTRPYATPVAEQEELARVLPVIQDILARRPEAIVSIDTSKAVVAQAAVAAGAEIINDVTGLGRSGIHPLGKPGSQSREYEPTAMVKVAAATQAAVCVMHMQGTPQTMQDNPFYEDVVEDIATYFVQRIMFVQGIARERICLDPGIGFGKTHEHNLDLLRGCGRLHDLGCPLLVGHSRKGFIGKVLGNKDADRTAGTIGAALALARQGVQIIRVHDVRPVREALLLFEACGGLDSKP